MCIERGIHNLKYNFALQHELYKSLYTYGPIMTHIASVFWRIIIQNIEYFMYLWVLFALIFSSYQYECDRVGFTFYCYFSSVFKCVGISVTRKVEISGKN